mgnify:CR=1 FL=1
MDTLSTEKKNPKRKREVLLLGELLTKRQRAALYDVSNDLFENNSAKKRMAEKQAIQKIYELPKIIDRFFTDLGLLQGTYFIGDERQKKQILENFKKIEHGIWHIKMHKKIINLKYSKKVNAEIQKDTETAKKLVKKYSAKKRSIRKMKNIIFDIYKKMFKKYNPFKPDDYPNSKPNREFFCGNYDSRTLNSLESDGLISRKTKTDKNFLVLWRLEAIARELFKIKRKGQLENSVGHKFKINN